MRSLGAKILAKQSHQRIGQLMMMEILTKMTFWWFYCNGDVLKDIVQVRFPVSHLCWSYFQIVFFQFPFRPCLQLPCFSSSLSRVWLEMPCFSSSLSRAKLKMPCFSSSLSRAWSKMLCFSNSFSSACTKCCVFPVPFLFPSSLPVPFPVPFADSLCFSKESALQTFLKKKQKCFLF